MDNLSPFKAARREMQRAELDRRSGMERRIRADAAVAALRERRCWDDRRTEVSRDADNMFVAIWMAKYHAARAAAR